MAIAFDAFTDGSPEVSGNKTFSHTTSGTNRILFVVAQSGASTDNVTGVTYAGTTMTLVKKVQISAGNPFIYLFVLSNPASGANDVVISKAADGNSTGHATSYTGAKQTDTVDASTTNEATSVTTLTGTVTTVADNCWLTGAAGRSGGTVTGGTDTNLRNMVDALGAMDNTAASAPKTPPGAYSLIINDSLSRDLAIAMASFAPAATVTSPQENLLLMGTG